MLLLAGLPDLGAPLASVPGTAFRAFDRSGLVVALPDRLGLEAAPDGSGAPVFLLTLLRGVGGGATGTGGRLDLGFTIQADLVGIGRALAEAGVLGARLAVAEVEGGVLALRARLGPLAPTVLAPARSVPPDLLAGARLVVDLSAEAASVAARLIEGETLPVEAVLRLSFRAVVARLPLVVTIDPRALAERLAGRFGAGAVIAEEGFASALDALLGTQAAAVEGNASALDPDLRASTLALRLKGRLAGVTLSTEAELRLLPPGEVPSGRERIDLAAPAPVTVERTLAMDPFLTARALAGGVLDRLVRRIDLPPLPTGRVRVALAANLTEPVAGLAALIADLRVPPAPPFRPQPLAVSVALDAPERRGTAELRLAPGEAFAGEVRLRAVLLRRGEPIELAGPWQPATRPDMSLGPDCFPVPLTVLRLSEALAALASAEVTVPGGEVLARLDAAGRVVALPWPPEPDPAPPTPLRLVVRPAGPGRTIELDLEAARRRLDLDVTMLPGFGAHAARAVGRFNPGARPVMFEWRPEAAPPDEPPSALRLGPDRQEAEIRWIADSPFRPGMVWRLIRGGSPSPWSAPVAPVDEGGRAPVIEISEDASMDDTDRIVIEGIELRPDPADPVVWTYLPPGPSLEQGADGAPKFSLVEAGPVAFLQATTRIDLPGPARARLLARLRETQPDAREIRAVPLDVRSMALEARAADAAAAWSAVATGGSSGLPPWTTALSATPTSEQVAAIKAALAGEKGRLRLAARLTLPAAAPAVERRSEAMASARITTPEGEAAMSMQASAVAAGRGGSAARDIEQMRDVAEFFTSP